MCLNFYQVLLLTTSFLYTLKRGYGASLTVYIPAQMTECFSVEKAEKQKLVFEIQLRSGVHIDVSLAGPKQESIFYRKRLQKTQSDTVVRIPGVYTICLHNIHTYNEDSIVYFLYDVDVERMGKPDIKHRIEQEKGLQLLKQQNNNKVKIIGEDEDDLTGIKETITLISMHMDKMTYILKEHSTNLYFQWSLQKRNLKFISWFSPVLCVIVFATALVQVYVLKKWFD